MVDENPLAPRNAESNGAAADRLNSWKEIATYLGKGVRTVQRWEVQMGLPVRRLGREGGEIVYALKSEIDAWLLNGGHAADPDPNPAGTKASPAPESDVPAPGAPGISPIVPETTPPPPTLPGHLTRNWIWSTLALVGLVGIAMTFAPRAGDRGREGKAEPSSPVAPFALNPVGAVFEGNVLRAWGQDGRPLWTTRIEAPNDSRLDTRRAVSADNPFRQIAVEDLDGDSRNEVLLLITAVSGSGGSLRVFNADGSQRFTHLPGRPVTFGGKVYEGFNAYGIYVFPNPGAAPSLWVTSAHVPWFPSVLAQISPAGEIRSEYWSNGYIFSVRPATLGGRSFLLVGAYNNERRGGSLAILDRARPSGVAPAENPAYRCTNCADGDPEEFLVFPPTDALREGTAAQGSASVIDARLTGQSELVVSVRQLTALVPGESIPLDGSITYTLSAEDLGLRQVAPGWGFLSIHSAFQRAGRLDHPFGPRDEKEISAILRWRGGRFVPLSESLRVPAFARAGGDRAGS